MSVQTCRHVRNFTLAHLRPRSFRPRLLPRQVETWVRNGITLLERFTYGGDSGSAYFTPWVAFPVGHTSALLVLISHSRTATGQVNFQLQASWDSASGVSVGSVMFATSAATQLQSITTGLGPFVRVLLSSSAEAEVTISAFLVPQWT